MRNILVTGGAGFIGVNFVHYVLERHPEDQITVLDKLTYAGNLYSLSRWKDDRRFRFVSGDICDRKIVTGLLESTDFTHVAHFAAESHVDRSIADPEVFVRTNVLGTFVLLEALRNLRWGSDSIRRLFLHVSTDEVFGSLGETGRFNEETPYRPNSPYSATKAGSDHLARAFFETYSLPVAITNCSNNYGPFQFPEKLIPLMIINCLRGQPLPVYGEGSNVRDWLFVEDHVVALNEILLNGEGGETYTLGGNNEWRNIDLVHELCKLMDEVHPEGAPHDSLICFVRDRLGHDKRYAIDPGKIERKLGWKPAHDFRTGLRRTVEWYVNNEEWWMNIASGEYRKYFTEFGPR